MSYSPARIGEIDSLEGLREYVQEELEKISKEFNETIALDLRTVHQEPKRPREGMIVSADGTDWNPGSGAGAYEFVNGVWRRVAGIVDGDYGDIVISSGVWTIDNNVVNYQKLIDVATARILGRISGGTGDTEALSGTQVTTLLDVFTSALKGLVPASGGGSTNFLRADGTWNAPPNPAVMTKVATEAHGGAATYTRTGLGSYELVTVFLGSISHGGANSTLRVELSGDSGASGWSTAVVLSATVAAAGVLDGNFQFSAAGNSTNAYVGAGVSGNTIGGVVSVPGMASGGNPDSYRLSWSAGASFDSGTIHTVGHG